MIAGKGIFAMEGCVHAEYSRRFPNYGWAWPTGSTEQLLRAAGMRDEVAAKKLFVAWMQNNDIDDVTWAEQRLLLAIAARFSQDEALVPNRARLNGLVRVFWTKSRLSLRAAEPVLAKLVDARIDVLVFKGVARSAENAAALKGRVANDVDLLVRPKDFKAAIEILGKEGWEASTGRTNAHCCAVAKGLTGLNFFKGDYGDIDLHQSAYHELGSDRSADLGLWQRTRRVEFLGVQLHIPSPTDQLLIAIAHGGIDGHTHSDWVLDCDSVISSGKIDWDLFLATVPQLKLAPHAAIILTFLHQRLQTNIPADIVANITKQGRRSRRALLGALLQARPHMDHSSLSDLGRSFFKQARLRSRRAQAKAASTSDTVIAKLRRARVAENHCCNEQVDETDLDIPAGATTALIELYIRLRPQKRRYEFEVNEGDRHVARLTFKTNGSNECVLLTARVPLTPREQSNEAYQLRLEARPWKFLLAGEAGEDADIFNKVPFRLYAISFEPED